MNEPYRFGLCYEYKVPTITVSQANNYFDLLDFFLCCPCMPFPTAQGKGQCKVSLAQQTYHLSSCVIVPSTASFWLTSIVRSGTTDSTQWERCDFLKTSIHCAALCLYCRSASFTFMNDTHINPLLRKLRQSPILFWLKKRRHHPPLWGRRCR